MINNVTLLGRFTSTPEVKTTASGTPVTGFCLAVDRRFTPKDGVKQTDFINCVAWRNTAEFIARHFSKGDMIAVTGEIRSRRYQDKDGSNRTAVEVTINQVSFCGGKNNNDNAAEYEPAPTYGGDNVNFEQMNDNDELPF